MKKYPLSKSVHLSSNYETSDINKIHENLEQPSLYRRVNIDSEI